MVYCITLWYFRLASIRRCDVILVHNASLDAAVTSSTALQACNFALNAATCPAAGAAAAAEVDSLLGFFCSHIACWNVYSFGLVIGCDKPLRKLMYSFQCPLKSSTPQTYGIKLVHSQDVREELAY